MARSLKNWKLAEMIALGDGNWQLQSLQLSALEDTKWFGF